MNYLLTYLLARYDNFECKNQFEQYKLIVSIKSDHFLT